jgi:hypothetical protein
MFLLNMLGALILLPALAYFLLPQSLFDKPIPYVSTLARPRAQPVTVRHEHSQV